MVQAEVVYLYDCLDRADDVHDGPCHLAECINHAEENKAADSSSRSGECEAEAGAEKSQQAVAQIAKLENLQAPGVPDVLDWVDCECSRMQLHVDHRVRMMMHWRPSRLAHNSDGDMT